jgi:hypothetical protein
VAVANLARSSENTPTPDGKGDKGQNNSTLAVLTLLFVAIAGIATALIAIFNCQLVRVTKDMMAAANAAAVAADAALHLNRPAIVVTGCTPQIGIHLKTGTPDTLVGYRPHIYNLGSGPAEITGSYSHSRVFDAYEVKEGIPEMSVEEPNVSHLIWDFPGDCREFPRTMLGAGETFDNYLAGYTPIVNWIEGDIEKVRAGEKRCAVYGMIVYRSSVKEYRTRFFYWYNPERRAFYRAIRPELNERT